MSHHQIIKFINRKEFITCLYNVCIEQLISNEAIFAFKLLFEKLSSQRALPITFALLAHEIGHLDASFCCEASVHSITVAGRTLTYNPMWEEPKDIWRYSFSIFKINESYTYAYSVGTDCEMISDDLKEMYVGGRTYSKHVETLKYSGLWKFKNPFYNLQVKSHLNANIHLESPREFSDTDVLNKLEQNHEYARIVNQHLKDKCYEKYNINFNEPHIF